LYEANFYFYLEGAPPTEEEFKIFDLTLRLR